MGIFPGGAAIKEVFAGAPIKEVYAGSELVWKSGPSWPITGDYNITDPAVGNYDVGSWTATESGTYTISITRVSTSYPSTVIYINGAVKGGPETGTEVRTKTVTQALSVGDVVLFRISASPGMLRPATGTWSINKTS